MREGAVAVTGFETGRHPLPFVMLPFRMCQRLSQPMLRRRMRPGNRALNAQWSRAPAVPPHKKPTSKKPAAKTKTRARAKANGGAGAKPTDQTQGDAPKQDTVFSHPSPAAGTQRTVASSLGEIVWLMSQSATHKTFFISDLEWMVMTPVLLQQFRIFYDQQKPIGVALWGFVDEEVEARLSAGNAKLKPQDWKSGEKLWLVEVIAPFGGHEAMLQDLKSQVFPAVSITYLSKTAKSASVRVV